MDWSSLKNTYANDAKGMPSIIGSVIVGSTENEIVNIDINGILQLQYDCTAHQHVNLAAEKDLDADLLFKQISIYEQFSSGLRIPLSSLKFTNAAVRSPIHFLF